MIARVTSCATRGIEGYAVDVEVDISGGLPALEVVGLPDAATREARQRVRSAICNSGFIFPMKRIVVNLAPATLRKEGVALDLPIACGVLAASGQISQEILKGYFIVGELSLGGSLRPAAGVLPMALAAKCLGMRGLVLPLGNVREAGAVPDIEIYGFDSLADVAAFLSGLKKPGPIARSAACDDASAVDDADLCDVAGQYHVKRALEVAAAGGHNVLLVGPPGAGKTMLARRVPTILPELSSDEALEVTAIYSIAGKLPAGAGLVTRRPFRAPHHTTSRVALVGGGNVPKPGEISLAHRGVLFLDELPEFKRDALEALRQPMEDGKITLSRAHGVVWYPARFMLVGALNPCPCGFWGEPGGECTCKPSERRNYLGRISGPLWDRIDIQVRVPRLPASELVGARPRENSREVLKRVIQARKIQAKRFFGHGISLNAEMSSRAIEELCEAPEPARRHLADAIEKMGLGPRAYMRILKVARSIADLAGDVAISESHIREALLYRNLDRDLCQRE